jgi:DNA sulfur modification protein DndE
MNAPPSLPSRIRLSQSSSDQLTFLKTKTGLTPNILARIAFSLSLKSDFDYRQLSPASDGLEFNLGTLLGEHIQLYELLLLEDCDAKNPEELTSAMVSHIDNGLSYLKVTKTLGSLVDTTLQ